MRRSQSGVALITAVMIVAFASTVGAAMMVRQNLIVHRSAHVIQHDLAWWYLIGLEEWASSLLDRDREDNQFDHLGELWAQPIDFLPVDEGGLAGRLVDLQGRFNLLSLIQPDGNANPNQKLAFIRLLGALESVAPGKAEDIASAVVDWMDPNTEESFPGGAEDGLYLAKDPPYRAANRPMESVSELLLVEGVTPKVYAELSQHVAIYPGKTEININTASLPVLMSLNDAVTPAAAQTLMDLRIDKPFESTEAFVADSTVSSLQITAEGLTVQSHYFEAHATANIGNISLGFVSLLERVDGRRTRALAHSRNSL